MATAATPKKATEPRVDADASTTKTTKTAAMVEDDQQTPDTAPEITPPEDKPDTRTSRKAKIERGECVVDDGTPHTGRAVNGVICSAHAMRYDADGKLRGAA